MNIGQIVISALIFLLVSTASINAKYVTDEELYKKAISIEKAVQELALRIKKMTIELDIMNDVFKSRPTRFPASEIPINDKGKPVVKLDAFIESMKKLSKRDVKGKIKDQSEEIVERKKTLARLKKEREEIFRLIEYRVRGSKK